MGASMGGLFTLSTVILTSCETLEKPSETVTLAVYSPASSKVVCHMPEELRGGEKVKVRGSFSGSEAEGVRWMREVSLATMSFILTLLH